MTIYVYLLRHRTEPRFLLGATGDLAARVKSLGSGQIELTRSLVLEVADAGVASQLEGLLQHLFAKYRCSRQDELASTWLEDRCWGRLQLALEHVQDVLPHSRVQHKVQVDELRERIARQRWPEKKLQEIRAEHERRAQAVVATAERAGLLLQELLQRSSFTAVVRTERGYILVGQAPMAHEGSISDILDRLMTAGAIDEQDTWGDDVTMCYAAPMCGAPGQDAETASDWYYWGERLVWSQQTDIPGFDVTMTRLTSQETKHAAELLAKCPNNYMK